MIPTRTKDKLPSSIAYPVGAERVTDALSSVPQIAALELWFIANRYGRSMDQENQLVFVGWFGSIQFGLHGRFPLLSVRSFSILLGGVYSGFGILAYLNSNQSIGDFSFRNQEYLLGISVMLLLSALGIVFLPKLKMQADKEDERLTQERDQRLDQLYPWIDSRSGASNQISTNKMLDRTSGPTDS